MKRQRTKKEETRRQLLAQGSGITQRKDYLYIMSNAVPVQEQVHDVGRCGTAYYLRRGGRMQYRLRTSENDDISQAIVKQPWKKIRIRKPRLNSRLSALTS
jgi:hypothetical protein